jgi:hypothetical protein
MSFSQELKRGVSPYRDQVYDCLNFLKTYIKDPVSAMRHVPDWSWATLFGFYTALAALSGTISGLVTLRIGQVFAGLIIFPISATLSALLLAGFFYYTFSFIFKRDLSIKLHFTIIVLSMLPFFAVYTVSGLLEPIKLIGVAASSILLIIGLTEYSHIEKNKIIKLVGGLYLIYFVFWAIQMIHFKSETEKYKSLATPESYEQLKKEFDN